MSNEIHIPKLNPVSFRAITPDIPAQYLSHHFDDYHFVDTLQPWEQPVCYCQKVQKSDPPLYLQFISNFDPIPVEVINVYGQVVLSQNAVQVLADKHNPGFYCYEAPVNMASLASGIYWIRITNIGYISEPIELAEKFENTLLFSYFHTRYHEDVIFETGIRYYFRVEGSLGRLMPGSTDSLYIDQKHNPYTVSSKPFSGFPLTVGDERGVPDWVVQLMNYIWSCNNVIIEGKPYGRSSDFKLELVEEKPFPMRVINMDILPGINRGSKVINPTIGTIGTDHKLVVSYNIASRVFGPISGSDVIVITDFE
jgi:hypothetical protein